MGLVDVALRKLKTVAAVGEDVELKEEQREFKEFLQRLRFAKDRAEFDQFMAERRNRPRDARRMSPATPGAG